MTISIREAAAQLPSLVDAVLAGEEVILTRAGKPVARLVSFEDSTHVLRPIGMHAGPVCPDFEARSMAGLTEEELKD